MRLLLLTLLIVVSLFGCAKFKEGECIQNISDGTIWRVTAVNYTPVHFREYTMQAWYDGKWGRPVNLPFNAVASRYVTVTCPFSEKTIQ